MQKIIFIVASLFLAIGQSTAAQNIGETEIGKASYYSDDFNGRQTGYGDTYDMNALVGSHKRFPYGSRVRVTRLDNNRSVVVKIIDQGPYVQGRIMDLSRRAAEVLGMVGLKEVDVRIELLEAPGQQAAPIQLPTRNGPTADSQPDNYGAAAERAQEADLNPESSRERAPTAPNQPAPAETDPPAPRNAEPAPRPTPPAPESKPESPKSAPAAESFKPLRTGSINNGLYRIRIEQPAKEGFAVQVASLSNYDGVMRKIAELQKQWFDNILLSVEGDKYKVMLGPFPDEASAKKYEKSLLSRYKIRGFTVSLDAIQY